MGLADFKSQAVFLDTAPLIYFIEGNINYQDKLSNLFASHDNGDFRFVTSALTLLEVLVHPIRVKRWDLVEQYQNIFSHTSAIDVINLDIHISFRAADLRAKYGLKTPDAIQAATALEYNIPHFFTNDKRKDNYRT